MGCFRTQKPPLALLLDSEMRFLIGLFFVSGFMFVTTKKDPTHVVHTSYSTHSTILDTNRAGDPSKLSINGTVKPTKR